MSLRCRRYAWVSCLSAALLVAGCGGGNGPEQAGAQQPALSAEAGTLSVATKDRAYRGAIEARGGVGPYRFELVEGELPAGLTLDAATGEVSGIAARPGAASFKIRVTDARGTVAVRELTLHVDAPSGVEAAPQTLEFTGGRAKRLEAAPTAAGSAPDVSNLLNILVGMPENSWVKVNLNTFSSVWVPEALRPMFGWGNPTPSKIISAWSSFAWDSNRATLLLHGGGHANYRGNEVYLWRAATQRWERASLPSEMVQDPSGPWLAIDGADRAPASSHTYDNTAFLASIDRMVVFGGAADPNGGHFQRPATGGGVRNTGPYLFDPARADGNKVGGTTGSHVQRVAPYPDVVGGEMWQNRESWLHARAGSTPPYEALVNGCVATANEGGRDVAYVRTMNGVYRYTVRDVAAPATDTWERVGVYWGGPGDKATCSYDAQRKVLVRTGDRNKPFVYWNMATPGPQNKDVAIVPVDATGEFDALLASGAISIRDCALKHDPLRQNHVLWCGDGRVWRLTSPATLGATGWTIRKEAAPPSPVPNGDVGTGILGKWKYIPNLDAFMALQDSVDGNVWLYKPVGWALPSGTNLPPTVALTQPATGSTYTVGTPVAIQAQAADNDGHVALVEYFVDGIKIAETSTAPHAVTWTATLGTHAITAEAVDNAGARKASDAVTVTVNPVVVPNVPPQVTLTQPAAGSSVPEGPVTLTAQATDSDGTVAKVEFFHGSTKLGEATATPFSIAWPNPPVGSVTVHAVATDDDGAQTASAAVTFTVTAGTTNTTVVLQRAAGGIGVAAETYLSTYHRTLAFGDLNNIQDYLSDYPMLLRFAIFQSEGGPVPNGARIVSAQLSLYKYSHYDMVYALHRMQRDWVERQATWNQARTGASWAVAGANGVGTDYAATADATASTGFNPGWMRFDLTTSLQQMSTASPLVNHGWRMRGVSGYVSGMKRFHSSEYQADASLRPKLEIVYAP